LTYPCHYSAVLPRPTYFSWSDGHSEAQISFQKSEGVSCRTSTRKTRAACMGRTQKPMTELGCVARERIYNRLWVCQKSIEGVTGMWKYSGSFTYSMLTYNAMFQFLNQTFQLLQHLFLWSGRQIGIFVNQSTRSSLSQHFRRSSLRTRSHQAWAWQYRVEFVLFTEASDKSFVLLIRKRTCEAEKLSKERHLVTWPTQITLEFLVVPCFDRPNDVGLALPLLL